MGRLEAVRQATRTPFLVKLSPDLETGQAVDLAATSVERGAAGVVLTNTTIDYSLLPGATAMGGLSGRVLRERSFELLVAVARGLLSSVVPEYADEIDRNLGPNLRPTEGRRAAATGGESRIPMDAETERCVAAAGYAMDSVPDRGVEIGVGGEQEAQRKRKGEHPLPDRNLGEHVIDKMSG